MSDSIKRLLPSTRLEVVNQKITFTSISTTKIIYIDKDDAAGLTYSRFWLFKVGSEALKAPVGVKVED